jgi:hypothetical protein
VSESLTSPPYSIGSVLISSSACINFFSFAQKHCRRGHAVCRASRTIKSIYETYSGQ